MFVKQSDQLRELRLKHPFPQLKNLWKININAVWQTDTPSIQGSSLLTPGQVLIRKPTASGKFCSIPPGPHQAVY